MGNGSLNDFFSKLGFPLPAADGGRPARLGFDWRLVIIAFGLVIFGLVMVYSASADFSYTYYSSETYIADRQIKLALAGFAIMALVSFIPYQWYRKFAFPVLIFTTLALAAINFYGEERLGATRGGAGGSIQPSEMAKLAVIIYMAAWLFSHKEQMNSFVLGIVPLSVALGVVVGFLVIQPDLSAALTIVFIGAIMWFLGGGAVKQIGVIALMAGVAGFALIMVIPSGRDRFTNFWFGWSDLLLTSEHVQKGLMGFMSGGIFGTGIGKGEIKLLGLPFPHTDSIFAVIGEETGMIGSLGLVLAYLGLLWRGSVIALRAPDRMGRLLAGGVTYWILFEAMLNMLVMLGILPFAGQALPFISSGGSSLLVSLAAVGILLNISRQSVKAEEKEERSFDAVVDLRGRNGRRRVPRTVHPASSGYQRQP